MKSKEYWRKRFEQLEDAAHNYSIEAYQKIEPVFTEALKDIEYEITKWYNRFSFNNMVSIADAKRMLNAAELKELRWDVKEYIKHGKENYNDIWTKELENASARFHINRLEALKIRTQQAMELAFGNELDVIDDMVRKVYSESYYHSIFELQKGVGIGTSVGYIDNRKLERIISKPWAPDGKNFSERIWNSKSRLINEVHSELTRNCILGKGPDEAIKNISHKFQVSKAQAGRLVQTEQAFFHATAQKDAFNELDVEQFEIVATLDSHTSAICREMDGKHFTMDEYEPGVTAPPFHPWCRSVTAPYFDDEWGRSGERVARDKDGETYYVPADMTYSQWKEAFVADYISEQTKKEFAKYEKVLGNKSPTIEEFAKIKYNEDKWKMFKAFTSSVKSGELSALADFDLYKEISREVDEKLVGVVTSNNLTIIGKSNHSIARVIGSIEQRRNGVQVSDILDALTNKDSEILPVKEMKNGKSQKFRNKVVEVSVNPDTGIIIQVNPVHKRRKKVEP